MSSVILSKPCSFLKTFTPVADAPPASAAAATAAAAAPPLAIVTPNAANAPMAALKLVVSVRSWRLSVCEKSPGWKIGDGNPTAANVALQDRGHAVVAKTRFRERGQCLIQVLPIEKYTIDFTHGWFRLWRGRACGTAGARLLCHLQSL